MTDVVKQLFSVDGRYRAVVRRRDGGVLEVELERWTREFVPGHGEVVEPFWQRVGGPSLVDDLERALEVAAEELRCLSGVPGVRESSERPEN